MIKKIHLMLLLAVVVLQRNVCILGAIFQVGVETFIPTAVVL
jgi:hypothetical protein